MSFRPFIHKVLLIWSKVGMFVEDDDCYMTVYHMTPSTVKGHGGLKVAKKRDLMDGESEGGDCDD